MPLDYKTAALKAGGRDVDSFCISGFLAEDALVASLEHGVAALAERHLGEDVVVNLDGKGRCAVRVFDENRRLAVSIAKRVRADLHKHGLELKRAKVEVASPGGRRLGDHDMIAQVVTNSDLSLPDERTPAGLLSGELRCRRLWSESGRNAFRAASQKEADFELPWWQKLLTADEAGVWGGRFIILCCFDQACENLTTYADARLRGQDHYKGLWGWRGSGRMLVGTKLRPIAAAPAPLVPVGGPRLASAKASASSAAPLARAPLRQRRPWVEVERELSSSLRSQGRLRVAPVLGLFRAMKRNVKRSTDKINELKQRHAWTDQMIFKAPRVSAKAGGKPEWVATMAVLRQIHESL